MFVCCRSDGRRRGQRGACSRQKKNNCHVIRIGIALLEVMGRSVSVAGVSETKERRTLRSAASSSYGFFSSGVSVAHLAAPAFATSVTFLKPSGLILCKRVRSKRGGRGDQENYY